MYDKRSFCKYYISLIKAKNFLIFSFCPLDDYNSIIIKSSIFCLSFSLFYAVNFAFFNDEMIHRLYEDEGIYDIIYFIPTIVISFAISHIITIIIKFIFLSGRDIIKIKMQTSLLQSSKTSDSVKRSLCIKYSTLIHKIIN